MKRTLLIRLDDACPWHDRERWQKIENLLDTHEIRPLVAVIPDCQDPELRIFAHDADFWDRARNWQEKGWSMALHGCTHVFETKKPGLVPLNRYSEFAGLSASVQQEKIRNGMRILDAHRLTIRVWVAPAHSFDRTTLKILYQTTSIRLVSDGLSNRAFRRFGFVWVPQQLWRPRSVNSGLWTLCLHPNEMTDADFRALETFLSTRDTDTFSSWADWIAVSDSSESEKRQSVRRWGAYDFLFGVSFWWLRKAKKLIGLAKGNA